MQIINSVVCGASKGCIYKQIKPPLVGEHAFPLTGFVCMAAHIKQAYYDKIVLSLNLYKSDEPEEEMRCIFDDN